MRKSLELKRLHEQDELLLLPNAWDLLSAMVLEQAGFKAIGTTSWGVANAMGKPDGENITFAEILSLAGKLVSVVDVPVTVDIESGYSDDFDTIAENALKVAELGVAGLNIEDSLKSGSGLRDARLHGELLSKIRRKLEDNQYSDFFINARTDTYFLLETPFTETIERANIYTANGASGIFVPGMQKSDEIRKVAEAIDAPLNVMSLPKLTDCQSLTELGVKRFSVGNALSDATTAYIEKQARQIFEQRNTAGLYDHDGIKTSFA